MTPEQIKDYQIRAEGFAEGLRFGVNQVLQWISMELAKAEKDKEPKKEGT